MMMRNEREERYGTKRGGVTWQRMEKGSWKRDHTAGEKNERQISSIGHKYERGTRKEEKQGNSVYMTSRGGEVGLANIVHWSQVEKGEILLCYIEV
jgi:hypothetical protein